MERQDGSVASNGSFDVSSGSGASGNSVTSKDSDAVPIFFSSRLFSLCSWAGYYITLTLISLLFRLLYSLRVLGRHRIRGHFSRSRHSGYFSRFSNLSDHADPPAGIIVSNHSLYLDPALAACAFAPRRLYFTGMESHFTRTKKPFQLLVRVLGGFPIPNRHPFRIIPHIRQLLSRGHSIIFYPEGHMNRFGRKLQPFKLGAFYTASRTGTQIIPIVIDVQRRRWWFSRITVHILDPADPADYISPAENSSPDIKSALSRMAEDVREDMQRVLDLNYR